MSTKKNDAAVDTSAWSKRDMWRLGSGELAVRPGMRRIYAPDAGRRLVGGFTIFNSYVQEIWHYVFDVATTGFRDLRVQILDENYQTVSIFQLFVDVDPRTITKAVVEGQILIGSPDFGTLFSLVGMPTIRYATKVASDNVATTAIDVPRGIVCVFCNRAAIFDGRSGYFSDPVSANGGDLRTFVAENQNQRPGVVYGAHEGAGGMLVCVTSDGVYGLDTEAAAAQVVGSNGTPWRVLNHNAALSFNSSCAVRGRVYGLTQLGWAPIDVESTQEEQLADPIMPRALGTRVAVDDFRFARLVATDQGPATCLDDFNVVHRIDLQRSISAWWSSAYAPTNFKLRGTLRDIDGTELLLCENGVFAVAGDFEGDVALTSGVATQPTGALFGVVPGAPEANNTVRHVTVAAEAGGTAGAIFGAVRGFVKQATPLVDVNGLQIGTSTWGQTLKRYVTTPVATARFDFGAQQCPPTDDVGVEVGVQGCLARISPIVNVDTIDTQRPSVVA